MCEHFIPILKDKGVRIIKKGLRLARPARQGEEVLTIVNGEVLTRIRADVPGSMIIRQESADHEFYLLDPEKFAKNYHTEGIDITEAGPSFDQLRHRNFKYYRRRGELLLYQVGQKDMDFVPSGRFEVVFSSTPVSLKAGDFLVTSYPELSEIWVSKHSVIYEDEGQHPLGVRSQEEMCRHFLPIMRVANLLPPLISCVSVSMMVSMRLLLLAFAPLLASARGAEEPQERQLRKKDPGLQMRLSQHALDYMTQELLPKVLKSLSDVELSKVASGTYSNIDYRVWNVKINEIGVSKPGMTFHSPSGIELCLKGITANVSSAWFARWLFLTDAGRVNVVVPDGQVCASIELHTRKGQPKIKVAQLDVDLRLGPVSFTHSNLNWVMNVGAWLFQSQLEELASDTIRDQVSAVVRSDLSRALDKLDLNVLLPMPEVNDSIAVDLGVSSIEIMSNFLQVSHVYLEDHGDLVSKVCPWYGTVLGGSCFSASDDTISMRSWIGSWGVDTI
ncbi:BPI fold-containing family C protein [Symbiodinium microadriaticum]|uniref:BPI fold-containing family C protein n=1 Tax=Symbiodinium microadriaticum TaxID=2951 RepID=A0A1Q9DC45_SYMMI|nr:BPI fold-containing family C protein [Symbiodinium microadriaticum]